MKKLFAAAALAAAFVCAPAIAFAQATMPPVVVTAPAIVDFTQLAIAALPFVFAIVGVLISRGATAIAGAMHLQNQTAIAGQFNSMAQLALSAAQGQAADLIAKHGLTVDVKNQLAAHAAQWMADNAGAQIAAKKYDPADVANHLSAMIEFNTTPPESSVAVQTPPATPTPAAS